MCGPQSPWEPQGGSSPALPLAFGLSLQDWERTDAVFGSFHAGGPIPSSPRKLIKMPEMKKQRLREVKSSAHNTQQAGTADRHTDRQTLGLFGIQAHSPGRGAGGIGGTGHLVSWLFVSKVYAMGLSVSKDNYQSAHLR